MAGRETAWKTFPSLTGARGLCALLVFVGHLQVLFPHTTYIPGAPWAKDFIDAPGGVAVPFFFVMSGFLLTWNWKPERSVRQYMRIRVARIYPLHLITWTVVVTLGIIYHRDIGPGAATVLNLFLLQSWVPIAKWQLGVNGPSWTLSDELFMYALLPLFIVGSSVRVRRLAVAAVISLLAMSVALLGLLTPDVVLVFPLANLFAFVVGVMAAHVLRTQPDPEPDDHRMRNAALVLAGIALVCVVLMAAAGGLTGVGIPGVTFFWASAMALAGLLLLNLARRDRAGRSPRVLVARATQQLGIYSFGIYITHIVVLINVLYVIHGNPHTYGGAVVAWVVVVVGTLIASWVVHRFVEEPAYKAIMWRRTPRAVAATESGSDPLSPPAATDGATAR